MPADQLRLLDPVRDALPMHAERQAVVSPGFSLSYAELHALTDRLAAAFRRIGLSGTRVGVLLPNLPAFPAVAFGLLRAGARPVMLNPQYSPREVGEAVLDAGASSVVTVEGLADLVPPPTRTVHVDGLPRTIVTIDGTEREAIDVEAGDGAELLFEVSPAPEDEAVVVFTAATQGRARGARLSHANLVANLDATVEAMQLGPADRVLAVLPLVHLFGFTVTHNAALAAGACVLPVERFNPARVLDLLERERVTVICGIPGVFRALSAVLDRRGPPEHSLRVAICGGSPLPAHVARRWEAAFKIPLREGYGLTEAGPVCLFNRVDQPNRPQSLGHPFPGVEVSIRHPTSGAVLPGGEVGEICVRGRNVFLGYLGARDRATQDFHGDWLRTGDLGSAEEDGTVRYRGLLKPMFTRNGFNVYPAEIERVLEEDPRIARVSVCALPDPARENEIVLFVTTSPGAELDEEDVRALCRNTLAAYKQPGRIEIG